MTTPVNLNKARKQRDKATAEATAASNRALFGRTKQQKSLEAADRARAAGQLDGAKRER